MITKTAAFQTSDNKTHATLEDAQLHALEMLLGGEGGDKCARTVIAYADQVVDILTTTATSKPRARKVNGGTKKRTKSAAGTGPAAGTGTLV